MTDLDIYRDQNKQFRMTKRKCEIIHTLDVRNSVDVEILQHYGKAWIGQEISAPYHGKNFGVAISFTIGERKTGVWLEVRFKTEINGKLRGRFFKNFWQEHEPRKI
jgi:hypothetical protein